jgi:hypothetical protein
MSLDNQGHVVVSGNYTGSMQVDDRLLVTPDPQQPAVLDSFIASFPVPSLLDQTPPEIGVSPSPVGPPIFTVPGNLFVQAMSSAGAVVFFMPPTVIDSANAGASVACSPPPNTLFSIGTTPVTCIASDPVGHHSSATFQVTVADTLGPMILQIPAAITAEATGPTGAVVTYTPPVATDSVDGNRPVTCDPPSGSTFSIGAKVVTCTSTDSRGNTSTAPFTVNVVDTTRPTLTLPGTITATATSAAGAPVSYSVSATDAVDGAITPVCAPVSGSTFAVGATRVDCKATDAHGNFAMGSFQVQVKYGWSGFQQPIDLDGSSVFKLGSTIPVKFRLGGASGAIPNAVANLSLAKISSSVTGTFMEAVSTAAATTGNQFRYDSSSGQYIFNLSTKNLSTGTWLLSVDLHDGVSRTVVISLR